MQDPFEPTPVSFHSCVERKLSELQRSKKPAVRVYRWAAVLAAMLALLCGTALALEHLGALYFLTERIWEGAPVDDTAIVQPVQQHCDSELLDAAVRDAYWDGETLSVAMHVLPKGDYAFYTETDRGADGERFDLIWWDGDILPFEQWKNGRAGLMLKLPSLIKDEKDIAVSWDWVQSEQGETMLIQGACDDMTQGATLVIRLECVPETDSDSEVSTLTFTLPPMAKGAPASP